MREYKLLIILVLVAILFRLPSFFARDMPSWDGAVYLSNAEYFRGNQFFFEELRPPVFPLLLASVFSVFGKNYWIAKIVTLLFSAGNLILVYLIGREIFNKKAGLVSFLLLLVTPIHVFWSAYNYTGIPGTFFTLLSLLLLFKWFDRKSKSCLYLAFLFASIAFLTRYVLIILVLSYLVILLYQSKSKILIKREFYLSIIIFLLPIIPWLIFNNTLFHDPFHSFKEAIVWPILLNEYPVTYYITNSLQIFSVLAFVLPFAIFFCLKKRGVKNYTILTYFLLFFFIMSTFSYKEPRFLLPLVPIAAIICSSLFSYNILKGNENLLLTVILVVLSIHSFSSIKIFSEMCDGSLITGSLYLKGKGIVTSTFWPITAYYAEVNATPFPVIKDNFETYLRERNISYIITSKYYGWPDYAKDERFFQNINTVSLEKKFVGDCETITIYKVNKK